ncbi:MAG: hypothetical protein JO340_01685 [Acidobacteriaceae bacterium]|nr:hypothetical protein [Acidobacteriaceae bacterium]
MSQLKGHRKLNKLFKYVVVPAAIVAFACKMWGGVEPEEGNTGEQTQIINRYLQAVDTHQQALAGAALEVDIHASVPKLKQQGHLHALRSISRVGRISYRVLGFQGDNSVKNQVIARYLEAEQQAQGKQDMAITPANYKLKYKGERALAGDRRVYVFDLAPRKKRVGLFKGEMWLDGASYLPVFEKGRLVKNPSIFFKRVDFERGYNIQGGVPVPSYTASEIDTRLVGKVELNVSYSNFTPDPAEPDTAKPAEGAEGSDCSLP